MSSQTFLLCVTTQFSSKWFCFARRKYGYCHGFDDVVLTSTIIECGLKDKFGKVLNKYVTRKIHYYHYKWSLFSFLCLPIKSFTNIIATF